MQSEFIPADPRRLARRAGLLYLIIIVAGIGGEVFLRGPLWVDGDASATAALVAETPALLKASILSDVAMALADVALAVLLFALFRPVDAVLSLMAMVFRLVQAAILGMNLGALAMASAAAGDPTRAEDILSGFEAHALGYDLGLIFFGINCLITATLICRSGFLPKALGALVFAAGLVYLAGSTMRLIAPELVGAMQIAYVIPLIAETAFMVWLLAGCVDLGAWRRRLTPA